MIDYDRNKMFFNNRSERDARSRENLNHTNEI